MRGALASPIGKEPHSGIIPADAGSTYDHGNGYIGVEDHPRGCGEHAPDSEGQGCDAGSSPRMRGARPGTQFAGDCPRIIPADAGSTLGQRCSSMR